jgi:prepilin-type N-terminal cleavage/methylation domain-containing protein
MTKLSLMRHDGPRGFTLIELLVVIAIIGCSMIPLEPRQDGGG